MKGMVLVHVFAGGLALLFGFAALTAAKGATLHRRSGMLFVYAMVAITVASTFGVVADPPLSTSGALSSAPSGRKAAASGPRARRATDPG